MCPNIHIVPRNKICTPTYTDKFCRNGEDCKFNHFLPANQYCCENFLFGTCEDERHCNLIHISKNSMIFNLLKPFKDKFIRLYISQVRHFYTKKYLDIHKLYLDSLRGKFKSSYTIASFRTNARCIICNTKASDTVFPSDRIITLLLINSKSNSFRIPKEIIKMFVAPYMMSPMKHKCCIYLRQKSLNRNLLQIYERRLVRRDVPEGVGDVRHIYVPRALPSRCLPKVCLTNLMVTSKNLNIQLPANIVTAILDRALEYLPVLT